VKKLLAVIRREYVQGVRNKGFIISTLLAPAIMALFFVVPVLLATLRTGGDTRLAVVDLTGGRLYDPLSEALARVGRGEDDARPKRPPQGLVDEDFKSRFAVERVEPGGRAFEDVMEELRRRVLNNKLDAFLVIPPEVLEGGAAQLYLRSAGDVFTRNSLAKGLSRVVADERLRAAQLDGARVRELTRPVEVEQARVTTAGEQPAAGTGSFILPFLVGTFILIAIMMYGQVILSAVVEEKTTRIVEVLFSSLRAFPLLLGKLVGVSLVGFTQFAIWALMFIALGLFGGGGLALGGGDFTLPHVPTVGLVLAPVFFTLGFYIYGTLYAVVGSVVTSEKEATQIITPVSFLPALAIYLAFPIIRNPNSSFSFWVSMVPFFSPITMLVRIITERPPAWQIALSLLIGVATVVGLVWVASRIYRTGMLMYGKRATIPEVLKWVRQS
jgi:ABC-2 type transport system permease protein